MSRSYIWLATKECLASTEFAPSPWRLAFYQTECPELISNESLMGHKLPSQFLGKKEKEVNKYISFWKKS